MAGRKTVCKSKRRSASICPETVRSAGNARGRRGDRESCKQPAGSTPRRQRFRSIPREHSVVCRSAFLHDLPPGRLQWTESAPRQEPHAFVFVTAVDNIDSVTRDRVMKCRAGILGYESEEGFPPRIVSVSEH